METSSAPTVTTCEAAADNWRWDGKKMAQSCAASYPDMFTTDRAGSRGVLWDVDYTWSYQFSQFVNWLTE